jgi:uncharacterized protein YbaR (Trm112 family)
MKKPLHEILVCPQCYGPLHLKSDHSALVCFPDRLAFPIHDDIPVMLVTEAQVLTLEEVESVRQEAK